MMTAALMGHDVLAQDVDDPVTQEVAPLAIEPIELDHVIEGITSFSALEDEAIQEGVGVIFDSKTSSPQEAAQAEADGFYVHETPLPGALKQYLIYRPFEVESIYEDEKDGKVVVWVATNGENKVKIAACSFLNAMGSQEEGYLFEIAGDDMSEAEFIGYSDFIKTCFDESSFVYPDGCAGTRDASWAAAHEHQDSLSVVPEDGVGEEPEPKKERSVALSAEASVGAGVMFDEVLREDRTWTAATLPFEAGLRLSGEHALNGLGLGVVGSAAYAASDKMKNGFGLERLGGVLSKGLVRGDGDWQVAPGLIGGYSWDPTTEMLNSPYGGLELEVSREVRPGQSVAIKAGTFARMIYRDLPLGQNLLNSGMHPGGYVSLAWVFNTPDYFDRHGVAPLREERELATDAVDAVDAATADAFIDASRGESQVELPALSPAEEAETVRFREELHKFGKRGKWDGAMDAFDGMLEISEAHLTADDYHWAAQAARAQGSLNKVYEFISKADGLGSATEAATVAAWHAEFGEKYFETKLWGGTVVLQGGSMAPDVRAAIEFANQVMSVQGYYEGWIPEGVYIVDGVLPTAQIVTIPEEGAGQ